MLFKYNEVKKKAQNTRDEFALIAAKDMHALTANRIQNQGKGPDGTKFKLYSQKVFPYWFLNDSDFNAPSKIKKFKQDAAKKKNNGSYHALRKAYGLPVDKRTLTFDGGMFKSIDTFIESSDANRTTVVIKPDNQEDQKKVNYNSSQLDVNILSFGQDEKDLVKELMKQRLSNLLNNEQ